MLAPPHFGYNFDYCWSVIELFYENFNRTGEIKVVLDCGKECEMLSC